MRDCSVGLHQFIQKGRDLVGGQLGKDGDDALITQANMISQTHDLAAQDLTHRPPLGFVIQVAAMKLECELQGDALREHRRYTL